MKKLERSHDDKMLCGVCGGLSKSLGIDTTWIRVFFALTGLLSGGFPGVLVYVVLALVMPPEPIPPSRDECVR